jgi:hypothetical protein
MAASIVSGGELHLYFFFFSSLIFSYSHALIPFSIFSLFSLSLVGFLGAGVITNNRKPNGVYDKQSSVKGLTTAAAIWVSAAVGVSAGTGLYFLSFFVMLTTITILRVGKIKKSHEILIRSR